MNLSSVIATLGLTGKARTTSTEAVGTITLGSAAAPMALTDATGMYAFRVLMAALGDVVTMDPSTGTVTTAESAWASGTAQVETATAAGTITTAGNATVTVTAAGLTGSPLAITFAVALADTATLWAAKARAALAANAAVAAMFTVSGTTTAIVLTRKEVASFTVPDGDGGTTTLYAYAANDATLNIATADDTSAGITEAAGSTNTTAGVAASGVVIYGGAGEDFEGVALDTLVTGLGIHMHCVTGKASYLSTPLSDEAGVMNIGEKRTISCASGLEAGWLGPIDFAAVQANTEVYVVFAGAAA